MELLWVEHGSRAYLEAVQLRRQVLRLPLGLDFTEGQLAGECVDHHLAGFVGGRLVACLVLTDRGGHRVQMRQVAVSPSLQGQGLGAQLVKESEQFAARLGYTHMVLHARATAVPFYEKLGYTCEGEPFEEVSLPHREMIKFLDPPAPPPEGAR